MNRRAAIGNMTFAAAASFVLFLCASQAVEPTDLVIRSDVRLVLLDASVKDHSGGFVSGLSKENFRVFENGKPQTITVFASDDVPVTVGILVDQSYSMTPKRLDVIRAGLAFIEESNPRDEIFVLNFNDTVKRGLPEGTLFSDNLDQLRAALSRAVPEGKTALYDAVAAGLEQLELGRRDKKALIVISDGGDNVSKTKRPEMLAKVEQSLATIYTIGLFDADNPDRDPHILKKLANISGGEAYFPASPEDMVPVCQRIAKDIRARYTIGYIPAAAGGERRHIRVEVSATGRGHLSARTRASYWYHQPGEEKAGQAK